MSCEESGVCLVVSAVEPSAAQHFPNVTVFSADRISASEAEYVAHAVGRVLEHRGISGGARVRLSTANHADGPMLVQVNLHVRNTPARVQALTGGPDDLSSVLVRLDRQIVRVWAPWRPRPWPDRTRRILTASAEALVSRRKAYVLQRGTPLEALAVMDAMDYDVHLFTDIESGEEAVVYRAGPSGLRLARQRRMYPPGWSWSPAACNPPVPLIVNSSPTPVLSETAAVERAREGLRFLFFTDPETGRGRLLYPRYDGNLGLITPVDHADKGENAAK
ncbi:sigma 54 modulation/S30EA ribosomal C-terminal domain-containing protein [Mycobacterium sp. SM1]|nr:sigma 54 modulation/S30EA ribosomal C-terminal domain-containing protein [Mycobacterium sp. SM1]